MILHYADYQAVSFWAMHSIVCKRHHETAWSKGSVTCWDCGDVGSITTAVHVTIARLESEFVRSATCNRH